MKKLLITLITISMLAITACGDEGPAPPVNPDPIEIVEPFVWGESTWKDAKWKSQNNEEE